jgi:alpha-tubulin suppressor-like RCC1 family protein
MLLIEQLLSAASVDPVDPGVGPFLYTWGHNHSGQIAQPKSEVFSWTAVSSGQYNQAAVRSDGLLFIWGLGSDGQMGNGQLDSFNSPIQVGTSSWTAVSCNFSQSNQAIRSDGRLFAWGNNFGGRLGDGTELGRSSPVQVGTSSWTAVSAGNTTIALRSDGLAFNWGINSQFQLGDSTNARKTSPIQVGNHAVPVSSPTQLGTDLWTAVSAGDQHTLAIKSNGLLFAWGNNFWGQLGDGTAGTVANKSSPVQIGTSSWTQVAASEGNTAAIRSDGLLFAWGGNAFGRLGDGTTVNKSSPVQIGTNSWIAVRTGAAHTVALIYNEE